MKICFLGTYDSGYARNKIIIDGLKANGVEIVECNIAGKGIFIYFPLLKKFLKTKRDYDYVLCAFPVQLSVFLALLSRKPIIVDVLISLYDTTVRDRKLYRPYHPFAVFLYLLDLLTVKLADYVIVDTEAHKQYFSQWCKPHKITVVPVGFHTNEFYVLPQKKNFRSPFLVQFHGSYIPLQGVEKMVLAAQLLQNDSTITFRFIGDGQEFAKIKALTHKLQLTNITFLPWLSIPELNQHLNEADVILGIFGESEKTNRVIPNKLYQGLAVKKPVITKDTPTIRTYFTKDELIMVTNSPQAIAAAIKSLQGDERLRKQIGDAGYKKVTEQYNHIIIGSTVLKSITV